MLIKRDFLYTPKGKNRPLHIYLPDDYERSDERYPVMYFFDGHNLYRDADATYGKSWGLEIFLNTWAKSMIIVGIECGHEGKERLDEYSPYSFSNSFMGHVHGMGRETMNWIVNEIKPMIDREYRTYDFREATAIGGSSMGGLMSLYAAAAYNQVFSKAACLSSAISPCFADMVNDVVRHSLNEDTRIYLSWGTEESGGAKKDPKEDMTTRNAKNNLAIAALLSRNNLSTKLYCQRGGGHCEADWEKQVPIFMNYLWCGAN